jgi:HK97 family phage major capsid protein
MTVKDILAKRAGLIANARALVDLADAEKRDMTAEERTSYDKIMVDVGKLRADADMRTALEREEAGLLQPQPTFAAGNVHIDVTTDIAQKDARAAFGKYLRTGHLSDAESRGLTQSSEPGGGYLVPEGFRNELIQDIDAAVFIRGLARVETITGTDSIGIPTVDTDVSDAEWTAETTEATEDTAAKFGKRVLQPHVLRKFIRVSNALIRNSSVDVEAWVRERFAAKNAKAFENGYFNGIGTDQPLGVFIASANGINIDRDISTGNTATAFTLDGLMAAKYGLAEAHRRVAQWAFNTEAVLNLAKMKDGEGRYIWYGSIVPGAPDTLLGLPLHESEYVPHAFTANLYVGILGDWKAGYRIVDSDAIGILVAREKYAGSGQTAMYSEVWSDGQPCLPTAFVRVQLGA